MMLNWTWPNLPRVVAATLSWSVGGFLVALLVASVAPLALGLHTYVVRSGSMTPTIDTGDLVITRSASPSEVKIGEIAMFKDPEDAGRLITHRVRAIHERNGRFYFVTRGDANTGFEHWNVPATATLGKVAYRIPKLGYLIAPVSTGYGKLLLVVLPALGLCAFGLVRIWAPHRLAPPEAAPR